MKTKSIILALIASIWVSGCVTDGISIRALKDPQQGPEKTDRVFIDPFRDASIDYRNQLSVASAVAEQAGIATVDEKNDAAYVMYLNFRLGLVYNSVRQEFEQRINYSESATGIRFRSPSGKRFGIINAGVFSMSPESNRTVWEGSVEVEDINDPNQVEYSLKQLFQKFGENFIGNVPRLERD